MRRVCITVAKLKMDLFYIHFLWKTSPFLISQLLFSFAASNVGNKGESQSKINNQIIFWSKPISSVPGRYISTSGDHGGHPRTPHTTLSTPELTLYSCLGLFYFCWLCHHPHHHQSIQFFYDTSIQPNIVSPLESLTLHIRFQNYLPGQSSFLTFEILLFSCPLL